MKIRPAGRRAHWYPYNTKTDRGWIHFQIGTQVDLLTYVPKYAADDIIKHFKKTGIIINSMGTSYANNYDWENDRPGEADANTRLFGSGKFKW